MLRRTRVGWTAALFSLLLFAPSVLAQRGEGLARRKGAAEHGWLFDYDEARAIARRTNKPLMVVFRCVP